MARTASEGPANHARVTELVAQGTKKSEAFLTVAREALGAGASDEDVTKKSRSIATNYYRIEREGAGGTTTDKPKPVKAVATSNGPVSSDVLAQVQAAINSAAKDVAALQAELASLREFKAKVQAATS